MVALAVPMVVAECGEVSPWLAREVLGWAARRLRPPDKAARYAEEWLADLEEVPGKLTKLLWAIGVAFLGVLRLREPKPSLDWTPRPVTSPFATDSVFGPGQSQAPQITTTRPQGTRPPLRRYSTPTRTSINHTEFPEGDFTPRRREPQPPHQPQNPGECFFHRYYEKWGDKVHIRRYPYGEDPEAVYGVPRRASPPVIGDR
ncbi:hypothetical protein JOD54_001208 [Actinokineospora baliensis]|uniref:hypothetical protein n=1 Tax=Actinokineospora baliensis TaxID=547056 RepID=UPI00195D7DCE|nr:hypothetical protein [Actinokineospora baliensis]MBM7771004.1 hypothetical protein [Actinokineospora baliensis]